MTAIMMASMGAAAITAAALETTVTVGDDFWFSSGTGDFWFQYGFSDGTASRTSIDVVGSISDNTYIDAGSTTRTIVHIYYTEDTGGEDTDDDSIFFGLSGTSIPNTDTTFRQIEYDGVSYDRSAATYYSSVGAANTVWRWSNVSPNGPVGGIVDFKVIL